MTAIERCIKEAVEKGGYVSDMVGFDDGGMFYKQATEENDGGDEQILFLDPLFWQALGKARGWENAERQAEIGYREPDGKLLWQGEWQYYWHRFIAHLASGKTAEEFFAELV
jgi:hypothetical protein